MHVTHIDPWRILSAAMAALVVALAAAVLLAAIGDLDLSTSDSTAVPATPAAVPTWVHDPIASPVAELRSPTP